MSRLFPLDVVFDIAGEVVDVSARNRILEETAKTEIRLGRLDKALRAAEAAPNRKGVFRQLAIEAEKNNDIASLETILRRSIEFDSKSSALVGLLASSLLAKGNVEGALTILRCAEQPFEGDQAKYAFVAHLLERDRFDEARQLVESINAAEFRDWSLLAFAKRYASLARHSEAEAVLKRLTQPEKRAWALFEVGRCLLKPGEWFRRAATILETIDLVPANAEAATIQRRIIGKALWKAEEFEAGRQLLESSEAALSASEDPFRRLRARCFLAKTLRETGELDSVRNYLDVSSLTSASFSPLQQSELLQWLAEASGSDDDWTLAARRAAEEKDEQQRVRRLAEIVRRFSYSAKKSPPTGDPDVDAMLLSGEEFEEQYYSPFAVEGCNC